jgi:hypothetical protein
MSKKEQSLYQTESQGIEYQTSLNWVKRMDHRRFHREVQQRLIPAKDLFRL